MKKGEFELLTVEQLRKKYGLTAANRPAVKLNPERVPESLKHLIPYAEMWGVADDLIRDDLVKNAPNEAVQELKRVVKAHDDALDDWLAGPESEGPTFSDEYRAFSAMRMAADFA